jgi:hypothetical protein
MEKFICPFCGTEFLTKDYLNIHARTCPFQYGKVKLMAESATCSEMQAQTVVEVEKEKIKKLIKEVEEGLPIKKKVKR